MSEWRRCLDALQWRRADTNLWVGTRDGEHKATITRFGENGVDRYQLYSKETLAPFDRLDDAMEKADWDYHDPEATG